MTLWAAFAACTAAVVFGGIRLSRYGDVLAEKWGLGRTWVGVAMMATVTSLPEMATGVSAVAVSDLPDIAAGDALGSCVVNLVILAGLDLMVRRTPLSARAEHGHIISAAFGILLLSIVAAGLILRDVTPSLGWVGAPSLAVAGIYVVAIRLIFSYEKRRLRANEAGKDTKRLYDGIPARTALVRYVLNAVAVVAAAGFLPTVGEAIAEATGLGQSFVGNVFIAISTSLPEIVVSAAAVRIGAIDLAVGNLLGSNIFNVFILALDDLFYGAGPLLGAVSRAHTISALTAAAMTAVAIAGVVYRAERKRLPLAWDSLGILVLYLFNVMVLYTLR